VFAGFVASKIAAMTTLPTLRAIGSGLSEDFRPIRCGPLKTDRFQATPSLILRISFLVAKTAASEQKREVTELTTSRQSAWIDFLLPEFRLCHFKLYSHLQNIPLGVLYFYGQREFEFAFKGRRCRSQ
jgi:hypothetical protein